MWHTEPQTCKTLNWFPQADCKIPNNKHLQTADFHKSQYSLESGSELGGLSSVSPLDWTSKSAFGSPAGKKPRCSSRSHHKEPLNQYILIIQIRKNQGRHTVGEIQGIFSVLVAKSDKFFSAKFRAALPRVQPLREPAETTKLSPFMRQPLLSRWTLKASPPLHFLALTMLAMWRRPNAYH